MRSTINQGHKLYTVGKSNGNTSLGSPIFGMNKSDGCRRGIRTISRRRRTVGRSYRSNFAPRTFGGRLHMICRGTKFLFTLFTTSHYIIMELELVILSALWTMCNSLAAIFDRTRSKPLLSTGLVINRFLALMLLDRTNFTGRFKRILSSLVFHFDLG